MSRIYRKRIPLSLLFGFMAGTLLAGGGVWYGLTYGLPLITASALIAPVLSAVIGFSIGLVLVGFVSYTLMSLCFQPQKKALQKRTAAERGANGQKFPRARSMYQFSSAPSLLERPKSTPLPDTETQLEKQEREKAARLGRIKRLLTDLSAKSREIHDLLHPLNTQFHSLWVKWKMIRETHLELSSATKLSVTELVMEYKKQYRHETERLTAIEQKMNDYIRLIIDNREYLDFLREEERLRAEKEHQARMSDEQEAEERDRRTGGALSLIRDMKGIDVSLSSAHT